MTERIILFPEKVRKNEFSAPRMEFDILKKTIIPFTGSTILFGTSESGIQVAIKISAKKGGADREWKGLNMAYHAGVSVPEPFALAKTNSEAPVLISEKIEGQHLHNETDAKLRFKLGKIMRDMHDQVKIVGEEWHSSGKPNFTYYDQFIIRWLHSTSKELGQGSKTQALLNKFASAISSYCETVIPIFSHNDLHEGQVFLRSNGGLTLLDFENWKEETQLNEIAFYLFHLIRVDKVGGNFDKFLNGYLKSAHLTETEKSIMAFYLLFISARAIEYFQNTKSRYLEKAVDTHNKILKYTDEERLWKDY
ncbi:hypothetical protein A2W13_02360 [Candidatus Woesebacteria bacterium RBG_16_36_11]|uniref:Aminoglycoside phosphotransferase domain-containing protein n=1 Tax=Candidatus Woesebacteria bacterium RBG_16_36_11 TaxID=1802481 RepID=A0A1F7X939_9BACT|nr:MAG: hypothetical protein A2W13_02360 [Candidatus Woesebacteria bacterium RBG_16_36_11]